MLYKNTLIQLKTYKIHNSLLKNKDRKQLQPSIKCRSPPIYTTNISTLLIMNCFFVQFNIQGSHAEVYLAGVGLGGPVLVSCKLSQLNELLSLAAAWFSWLLAETAIELDGKIRYV